MGKHSDQRDRTLCLTRILYQQTDEHHPLTMQQLLHQLAQAGLTVERKSVYRDLAAMNKWGFSVAFRPGKQGGWYAVRRPLDPQQVQAAVDAVGAYPWLPEGLRASLLDRLAALCPRWQRGQFHRPVSLPPHRGRDPETVRRVLDRIYGALQSRRALSFRQMDYVPGRGWQAAEPACVVSPKEVLWFQEQYHLLGWDHRDRCLGLYRVDRLEEPTVTGLPAQGPAAESGAYLRTPFGLEPRRRERVQLRCAPALAAELTDRLGSGAAMQQSEDGLLVSAEVIVGPAFWGWLTAHAEQVTLTGPAWAAALWQSRYCPRPQGRGARRVI